MKYKLNDLKWDYIFICPIIFIFIVIILSIITPGYNHLSLTISRLAIMKYGLFQNINFLILASGFALSAFTLPGKFANKESKIIWFRILIVITLMLIIETFFPTDAFETKKLYTHYFSFNAIIHLGTLMAFFLIAPFGVSSLVKSMKKDSVLKKHANITAIAGYTASVLCYLWVYLLASGNMLNYLGILQKIIILICFAWYLTIVFYLRKNALKKLT